MSLEAAGVVAFKYIDGVIHYLLLQHCHGHWALAKGKMEPGETQHQTALRELKEESGLSAQIVGPFQEQYEYWFVHKDGTRVHKKVAIFLAKTTDELVRLSREHCDYAWLPFADAHKQLSYGTCRNILQRAHNVLLTMEEAA